MRQITNAAAVYLSQSDFVRIECAVNCEFDAALRWAERLGFRCEAERLSSYAGPGVDAALFARLNSWS